MEISLSSELMALLEELVGVLAKFQSQYLVAIIPAAVFFVIYVMIMASPLLRWSKRFYYTRQFEKSTNDSIVILAHTQPSSLFDMFKLPMITLDDSNKLLLALRDIPKSRKIHLVLHTPGGMVIAAEQIARAIKARGGVEAHIPQYAMSGGTLVALACDKIHLGHNALLGPLDPQLSSGMFEQYPCASIVKALKVGNANRDDKTLILGDVAEKAIAQMKVLVSGIMLDKMGDIKSKELAAKLCDGTWTHDYGINLQRALELGFHVDSMMPKYISKIAETFPCQSVVSYRKKKDKKEVDSGIRITL